MLDLKEIIKDAMSATVGSVSCAYVGQPFDTVKVRMQASPTAIPTSSLSVCMSLLKVEGLPALWKGVVPTATGMMFENIVAFGVNEQLKRTPTFQATLPPIYTGGATPGRNYLVPKEDIARPMVIGFMTGCTSAGVLISTEIIKIRAQVSTTVVSSSAIVKDIVKKRGVGGLFAGFDAQLMRDGPFYAVFFGSYELYKFTLAQAVPGINEEVNYFLSGGFAGMTGWFMAMPFDVPKTILQSDPNARIFGDFFPLMAKVARERGVVGGLYAGLGPTLVRAFPSNAALFLGVEYSKKWLDVMF